MNQEIFFVTGKGGVGKSTFAAALALKKSQAGKRVLLVELNDQSFYQEYFSLPEVTFEPQPLRPNLWVSLWTGNDCLVNYARHLIKIESLVKLFFENSTTRALVEIAPGLKELSILGQISSGIRHHGPTLPFDCFVVDAFATGHFLALLRAPLGLSKAIQFGPMHDQSKGIDEVIRNPDLCKYFVVTLPEELPIKESLDLKQSLMSEFSINPQIVLNKVFDPNIDNSELHSSAQASSDAEFKRFLKSVENSKNRELTYRQILDSQDVLEIPQIFSSTPWTIIDSIAKRIPNP